MQDVPCHVPCALLAASVMLAGCGDAGTLATRYGDDILLDKYGIPSFLGQPNTCPGQFPDGTIQLSWDSGETRVKGWCDRGRMIGIWKAYYENGALHWKASFKRGLVVGTFKSWWANDEPKATASFQKGLPEGSFKAWHFNGEMAAKGKHVGGKKNGCWETWHENGQKASKGTYADNDKVLSWLYWTASGEKQKDEYGGSAIHGKCLITW